MSQLARIQEIIDWRNENIQEETYATHLAFDSIEQVIDYEETEINDAILDNITADEKFKIICRAKNFDIQELAEEIYDIIDDSDLDDKDVYLGICGYENEYMDLCDKYCLYIDEYILDTKDDWIKSHMDEYEDLSYEECEMMDWNLYVFGDEFNDKQKEFLQLAIKCRINRIILMYR